MPIKGGKMTPKERVFVDAMARTNDKAYAADKAGLSVSGANRAAARPEVQADIRRTQLAALNNVALPLAVDGLITIMRDAKATERGKLTAYKIVLDRTLGSGDASEDKEPHEMTSEELQKRIDKLRSEAADRARVVIEHEPTEAHDVRQTSAFD